MDRIYKSGMSDNVMLFVGEEVEHTQAYGKRTLFVVGTDHTVADLLAFCNQYDVEHVYLGANMSFDVSKVEWYDQVGSTLIESGLWVTLDFDVRYAEEVLEGPLVEENRFIPMVSVKVPYIDQLGYNACIKIDDKDFEASNPGVWVHRVRDLMDNSKFTDWSRYTKDTVIE